MAYQSQANRKDDNQDELDAAAKRIGAEFVSMTGDARIGFDRIYAYRGRVFLVEVKDGSKVPSKRKTTETEDLRIAKLANVGVKVHVIKNVDELIALLTSG